MQCATSLNSLRPLFKPIALTIGNFDGVHLGHLALLQAMKTYAGEGGSVVVISFRNHPSDILRGPNSVPLLCSIEHKIALIQQTGAELLVLLDFTPELAAKSAEEFLDDILQFIPMDALFLGPDGVIGRNREGTRIHLAELASKKGFELIDLPFYFVEEERVSSSRIRKLIQAGELDRAAQLLGRPYTIYSRVVAGLGKGRLLGTPTANLVVDGLCLPPNGVWVASCHITTQQEPYAAIANLGHAPTIRDGDKPLLEVYLLDQKFDLLEHALEVRFHHYLRPEQRFADIDALKAQIQQDVVQAHNYWQQHPLT